MNGAYVVTGTITDARTVLLDEPLPETSGKVRVILEPLSAAGSNYRSAVEAIWVAQQARGHVPPTAEQVLARVQAERDSWGDDE
jgi:hypothetical protein